ncbi:HD domain-containing protein [Oscillospiraceae bacterium WX1]
MPETGAVLDAMIRYYAGDARRIGHFLKVYGFAKAIGEKEGLEAQTQLILEVAALTHDIGIKNSELKYQSAAGPYQETEGPPEARKMLSELGYDAALIDRVSWLIAHHHTYGQIDDLDLQILVEADFIVNAVEDDMTPSAVTAVKNRIFRTSAGTDYLNAVCPVS